MSTESTYNGDMFKFPIKIDIYKKVFIFIIMKIIITESQMTGLWIKRRYDIVEKSYNETLEMFDGVDICKRYDGLDEFIEIFFWWFLRFLEDIYDYEEGGVPDNMEESLMVYYKQSVLKIYDESCS